MPVIYEPKGKAKEYAERAATVYNGCTHGCKYCYVPKMRRTTPAEYHARETPRKDFIKQFERDAKRLAAQGIEGPVHLTFSGDPFPPAEAEHGHTRQACEILVEQGLRACILTKGRPEIARPAMDILANDPLGPERHWWGVTVTSMGTGLNQISDWTNWEPGASPAFDRIGMLIFAKAQGLRTWVSLEPVIYSDATIEIIHKTNPPVNHFAVGKLNHFTLAEVRQWAPAAQPVDWPGFRLQVTGLLKDLGYRESDCNLPDGQGKTFFIKRSLKEA